MIQSKQDLGLYMRQDAAALGVNKGEAVRKPVRTARG